MCIEVKGRDTGSAGEKHAAQLEKWVMGHFEKTGEHAKGLLVVNGFKDVELLARTEPVFPAQMIPFSTSRGHALISGVQLLCCPWRLDRTRNRSSMLAPPCSIRLVFSQTTVGVIGLQS
jgi:hypothetical protein